MNSTNDEQMKPTNPPQGERMTKSDATINVRITERDYNKLKERGKPQEVALQAIREYLEPETWVATVRQSKPSCSYPYSWTVCP